MSLTQHRIHTGVLIFLCVVVIALMFGIGGEVDSNGASEGMSRAQWFFAVAAVLIPLLTLRLIVRELAGRDAAPGLSADQIAPSGLAEDLVARWLSRSHFYRVSGGIVGLFVAAPFVVYSLGAIVYGTLAGITVGGALAEIHVLRPKRRTAPVADLTVRTISEYTNRLDLAAMAGIALLATTTFMMSTFGSYGGDDTSVARWSLIALLIVGIVVALQHLVTARSRPALSAEMREADNLLRFLAATQGFTRPAIALAFFSLAYALPASASWFSLLAVRALVLCGLLWWWRGRPGRIPQLAKTALAGQANAA